MASFDTLNADTVDEFATALAGVHSMEEWREWEGIARRTIVPQLDSRCYLVYPNSEYLEKLPAPRAKGHWIAGGNWRDGNGGSPALEGGGEQEETERSKWMDGVPKQILFV